MLVAATSSALEGCTDAAAPAPMAILVIADVPGTPPGGMNLFISHTAAELRRAGHRVDLVFKEDLRAGAGARIRRFVVPVIAALLTLRASRLQRYDAVIIHEPIAAGYAALRQIMGRRRLPAFMILTFGSELRGWRARKGRAAASGKRLPLKTRVMVPLTLLSQVRYALRRADQILVPSLGDIEFLTNEVSVPAHTVALVPTGVEDRFFALPRAADRPLRALFIGSWIERKGIAQLVAAWDDFASCHPDAKLTLLGTTASRETVTEAFNPAVRDTIDVRESFSRQELPEVLSSHNTFVLLSSMEGMPLATLEAAAAGLACVVTEIPGHTDIFRPGRCEADGALLVAPNDDIAAMAAFKRLCADPRLRADLGRRARNRARTFSWKFTATTAERSIAKARAQVRSVGQAKGECSEKQHHERQN